MSLELVDRHGISSLRGQGHFLRSILGTFKGAPRPTPGATEAMAPLKFQTWVEFEEFNPRVAHHLMIVGDWMIC